jgi:hypothetical protein
LKAEFWVEDVYLGEGGALGGPSHVGTDQVRFYRDGRQLALADVPALLFSELMRDVDLFVGVTSIGNDPTWFDHGNEPTRRLLARLLLRWPQRFGQGAGGGPPQHRAQTAHC